MTEQLSFPLADGPPPSSPPPPPDDAADASASAPTSPRRCSSRPAPAPARPRRSSGASSRWSTTGIPIDAIAAITFTEKAAAELRHRLRERLTEAAPTRPSGVDAARRRPRPRPDRHAARLRPAAPVRVPRRGRAPTRLRRARRAGEPARPGRAVGRPPRELLDDADTEVAPGLRAFELVQLLRLAALRRHGGPPPGRRGLPGQLGPRRRPRVARRPRERPELVHRRADEARRPGGDTGTGRRLAGRAPGRDIGAGSGRHPARR